MTDQVIEVEQRHVVEWFNAEEFVVWVVGPDEFGRFTARTLSTRDRRVPEPGPTGIGLSRATATLDAWDHFARNRAAFDR